jgi:peptidoglycan/xylan/chitin deacetylase (PgdA/CDA1 family)
VKIALTFDNLGEAADLQRGVWPADAPLGRHASVTTALPRLLEELDATRLRATFCLEAINCEMYPDAVRGIAARGHEVAMHGWRHEVWRELEPHREEELLARGRAAFDALGIGVAGFRPPGGELPPGGATNLQRHGFTWCSALGARRERTGALSQVPFAWRLVDAYHRLGSFAARRTELGDPEAALTPDETATAILGRLAAGAPPTLILHPFLMVDDDGWAAARRVLHALADGVRRRSASVATAGQIAATLEPAAHPDRSVT